mgnify:FL=1
MITDSRLQVRDNTAYGLGLISGGFVRAHQLEGPAGRFPRKLKIIHKTPAVFYGFVLFKHGFSPEQPLSRQQAGRARVPL